MTTISERFWSHVDKSAGPLGCWEWQASKNKGYGRFNPVHGQKAAPAHRFAYEDLVGPIPPGLVIDHLCRNPGCVNPLHLEPVTDKVNVLRGVGFAPKNLAKTHCIRGHELAGDNLGPGKLSRGWRVCRECQRRAAARHHAANPKRGSRSIAAGLDHGDHWHKTRSAKDRCARAALTGAEHE